MSQAFLVFAGYEYYPNGGADDFLSSHATLADAIAAAGRAMNPKAEDGPSDWAHVASYIGGRLRRVWPFCEDCGRHYDKCGCPK